MSYEVAPWSADRVEDVTASCRGYVTRNRALGMFDCVDLLLRWRAAARDVRLGGVLAGELDHVCVDEYQDVNTLQVDLLTALCSPRGSAPTRSAGRRRRDTPSLCSTSKTPARRPDGFAWTPTRYRGSPHRSSRLRSSSMTALSQYLMENPPSSGFATGRSHRRCMTTW